MIEFISNRGAVDLITNRESVDLITKQSSIDFVTINKTIEIVTTCAVIELVIGGVMGPQGPPGAPGSNFDLIRVAGEDLGGHRCVVPQADGTVVYATALDLMHSWLPFWMTKNAASEGEEVTLLTLGETIENSWNWVFGTPIWLGDQGLLTQIVPDEKNSTFSIQLATTTENPTKLFWDPQTPIVFVDSELGGYIGGYESGYYGPLLGGAYSDEEGIIAGYYGEIESSELGGYDVGYS